MNLDKKRELEINAMRTLFKDNSWVQEDRENQIEIMKKLQEETELEIMEKKARYKAYMKNPVRCNPHFEFEKEDKEYLEVMKLVDGFKLDKVIKEAEEKLVQFEARLDFLNSQECTDIISDNIKAKEKEGVEENE